MLNRSISKPTQKVKNLVCTQDFIKSLPIVVWALNFLPKDLNNYILGFCFLLMQNEFIYSEVLLKSITLHTTGDNDNKEIIAVDEKLLEEELKHVSSISFEKITMSFKFAQRIGDILIDNKSIKTFSFCGAKFKHKDSLPSLIFGVHLRQDPKTALDLSGHVISTLSADALNEMLIDNHLEVLNLTDCAISGEGVSLIAKGLAKNKSLKQLNISGLKTNKSIVNKIICAINKNGKSTIEILNLSNLNISVNLRDKLNGALTQKFNIADYYSDPLDQVVQKLVLERISPIGLFAPKKASPAPKDHSRKKSHQSYNMRRLEDT